MQAADDLAGADRDAGGREVLAELRPRGRGTPAGRRTRRRRRAGRAASSRARRSAPARVSTQPAVVPVARDGVPEHAGVAARDQGVDGGGAQQARLERRRRRRTGGTGGRAARAGRARPGWPRSRATRASPHSPSGRGCVSVWLPIQWPSAWARSASARCSRSGLADDEERRLQAARGAARPGPGAWPPGPGRCRR